MNILYIAYSCNPYNGSEDKIGWNIPIESAKSNRVFVITKEEQRRIIEEYLTKHTLKNIDFYFVDIPQFYKKIFRGTIYSGRLNVWNRYAYDIVERLCERNQIDVIHQITPVEFRSIGDYGKIKGIKFVCGPIGGGEILPIGLRSYARKYRFIESLRNVSNYWQCYRYNRTEKLAQCDYIMFANRETKDFMLEKTKMSCPYEVISEVGLGEHEILINVEGKQKQKNRNCVFLVAGRLIYRKGHEFLLDALMRLPDELPYECRIVGSGPQIKKLIKKCEKNQKLSKHVKFVGAIPYVEMVREFQNSDVLIMPSIRETTGTVLLEAMSKGVPVITINRYGGPILLDEKSGWLYDGNTKEEFLENLSQVIIKCIEKPSEVKKRGDNAFLKTEKYTWDYKIKHYNQIYKQLIEE